MTLPVRSRFIALLSCGTTAASMAALPSHGMTALSGILFLVGTGAAILSAVLWARSPKPSAGANLSWLALGVWLVAALCLWAHLWMRGD